MVKAVFLIPDSSGVDNVSSTISFARGSCNTSTQRIDLSINLTSSQDPNSNSRITSIKAGCK